MQNIRIGVKISILPLTVTPSVSAKFTVLEDPDQSAKHRCQAKQIEHDRLDRDQHAACHEEEQH